ncbi:MAG: DUF429 domain-containing protein [Betaproteobacteria bacterium]|nr:MAG: DUF429 domain-containing protein [Betaproteobacteria bacterium]
MKIFGVDFTSAPCRRKPITVAAGRMKGMTLVIHAIERLETFNAFEAMLARPGPWVGGFDFPFGMPAELCRNLGWPLEWKALVSHCSSLTRQQLRCTLDAYRNSRPAGSKYAHRATDLPAGSSSPMKLVNPPVALMFHEGAQRIAGAGVHVPALCDGDPHRVALEAYPGLLARKQLGIRDSYKSDTASRQNGLRKAARRRIVEALRAGHPLGIRVRLSDGLERAVVGDGAADLLDAVMCATQAAWAALRPRYGLPAGAYGAEGWIVSA